MCSTSFPASGVLALGSSEPECKLSHSVRPTTSVGASSPNTGQTSHAILTSEISELLPRLISSVVASPASHSALHLEDAGSQRTSGLKCSASSESTVPATSLPKTSKKRQSPTRLGTSLALATQRTTAVYQGLIAGQTIKEIVGGLLHTPTRKANFVAPSMQKWPSCRRFVAAFGGREITPEQFEFLMGLPIGWTELGPSETPSSRKSPKLSDEQL